MKTSTVEVWVWVLIYGGLLLVCLSLFVVRTEVALGWGLGTLGGLATLTGVVLIAVRSRMGP